MSLLLAGDIGGTKTLLGLFEPPAASRPRPVAVRAFGTLDYDDFPSMIADFVEAEKTDSIRSACFGVAGPVIDQAAELTNVPWKVDAKSVTSRFPFGRVVLLNDLQAMAYSVPVLDSSEVHVLQEGSPLPGGNIALIAAGTGLGEALLHNVEGRFIPSPSEGGHADFPARNERGNERCRQIPEVLDHRRRRRRRVEVVAEQDVRRDDDAQLNESAAIAADVFAQVLRLKKWDEVERKITRDALPGKRHIGFSQRTSFPASRAARVTSGCQCGGVATITASRSFCSINFRKSL